MAQKQNNAAEMQQKVDELTAENKRLKAKLDRMNELLLLAQKARFAPSSEKTEYVMAGQNQFFDEAENEQNSKAVEPTVEDVADAVAGHKRKKKRTNEELLEGLPVQDVLIELPEKQLHCNACGGTPIPIGRKFLYREIQTIPQKICILDYYAVTYACKTCEEQTGYAHIFSGAAPPRLMKHSLASPSSVADVMVKKYVDGLPLYRQENIWKREGLALSRATLGNWVIQCAQKWLKPLYRQMKANLLESSVIYADETVVQVLKEDGKPATSQSRMWVYGCDGKSSRPVRLFEYQPDRSGKHAEKFLKSFSGLLVTDGYAGYNKVDGVTRCGCWAHMRRKWREAMPKGATMANSKAAIGYNFCSKLFALERKFENLKAKYRKEARQDKSALLLKEYFLWLETLNPAQSSKLAEAVTYAQNQRQFLEEFINHGDVEISNNFAENAIRPFTVGRKNWLFSDTVKGADSSAIVYTIVETARANGVEPRAYLNHILQQMPYLGNTPSAQAMEPLMPWNFKQ